MAQQSLVRNGQYQSCGCTMGYSNDPNCERAGKHKLECILDHTHIGTTLFHISPKKLSKKALFWSSQWNDKCNDDDLGKMKLNFMSCGTLIIFSSETNLKRHRSLLANRELRVDHLI